MSGMFFFETHCTYITCTHLYPAQNRIFSTKKLGVQPGIGIGIVAADSIGYRAPARYRSNPKTDNGSICNFRLTMYPKM